MKNLKYIVYIAIVLLFVVPFFWGEKLSTWDRTRKTKNEIKRLVDDYGLKVQNPIDDFYQCRYWYRLYEASNNLGYADKKLKEKDIFMVNCIPLIQEVLETCEEQRKLSKGYSDSDCEVGKLDPLIIEK